MHPDLKAVRDKLFTGSAVARETVTLGDGTQVDVLGMSVNVRGRIMMQCMSKTDELDEDDKPIEKLDMAKLTPLLVIESTRFVGTDERVFTEADTEAVQAMSASYLDPISTIAMRLGGIGAKAQKEAEGNSEATTV